MPKPRARPRRKSSAMQKRISKLEQQMVPIQKTFEQRQYDYTSAITTGLSGYALSHATSAAWSMSSLCPTLQSNNGASGAILLGTVRLGDKITLKSLSIRGEVRGTIGSELDSRVRVLLVKFKEYDPGTSAATLTSQVLQQYPTTTGAYPSNLSTIYSSYKNVIDVANTADLVKYQVLYDKVFNMQDQGVAASNNQNCWRYKFNINHRFKNGLVCQYGKNLSDEPELNNIVLIMISDSSIAPHPQTNFVSRFKYMDA